MSDLKKEESNKKTEKPLPRESFGFDSKMVLHDEMAELTKTYFLQKLQMSLWNERWPNVDLNQELPKDYKIKRIEAVLHHVFQKRKQTEKKKIQIQKYMKPPYLPKNSLTDELGKCIRYCIDRDISKGYEGFMIPMYCDLPMQSSDLSTTNAFRYQESLLQSLQTPDVFKEECDKIKCNCVDGCKPETCECMKFQKELFPEISHIGKGVIRDEHDYHKKAYLLNYNSNALICCGEDCKCNRDNCDIHIELFTTRGLGHRFEVFRRNIYLGFGLRTLGHIYTDQLIIEFTGITLDQQSVQKDQMMVDYSLELFGNDTVWLIRQIEKLLLKKKQKLSSSLREDLDKVEKGHIERTLFINPYTSGNGSRFVAHGCTPNIAPIRVIVNNIHPKDHKIFFKALFPIPAGSELFFNYGDDYLSGQAEMAKNCVCGTINCSNIKNKTSFDSMSRAEIITTMLKYNDFLTALIASRTSEFEERHPITGLPRNQVANRISGPLPSPMAENTAVKMRNCEIANRLSLFNP